jgi:hypothetical protein
MSLAADAQSIQQQMASLTTAGDHQNFTPKDLNKSFARAGCFQKPGTYHCGGTCPAGSGQQCNYDAPAFRCLCE